MNIKKMAKPYYDQPHRYYHTWDHVLNVEELYMQSKQSTKLEMWEEIAIMFHDAVYIPGFNQNERASGDLVKALFTGYLPQHTVEKAVSLIESTMHSPETIVSESKHPLYNDMIRMQSADYAATVLDDDYAENIRKEFAMYNVEDFTRGRKKFIEQTLNSAILHCPILSRKYEKQMKQMLKAELTVLVSNNI